VTPTQVRAIVEAEIDGDWSQSNWHHVDLRKCVIHPREVVCRNTFPRLNGGKPLRLWIVLEECPGTKDGYVIVFDEQQHVFGLANWDGDTPVFIGHYGTFMNTLQGM